MWESLQSNVFSIWVSGGPLMIALAILSLVIYGTILQVLLYLRELRQLRQNTDQWAHWIQRPDEGKGLIGDMIRYTQNDLKDKSDLVLRFEVLKHKILRPLDRQLRFGSVIITAAPLLGLLGTVIGMLATFLGLSISYGGNTLDLVASGISEALITTQTGLILAIPAMFFLLQARSQRRRLNHFLVELEARTLRHFEAEGGEV